jgi:Kef-type K+ transport system membrane component KefB
MEIELPSLQLPFFVNLLLLLVLARALGELFERFKQPAMIGEILAGVILGPSVLNFIHRTEDLKVISDLGVFLLVILAGLEIQFDDILKSLRGRSFVISVLAFFIPIISGFFIGTAFGQDVMSTVFIGLCVAITALPVSIRILMDLGRLNSPVGQKIVSVAIFDDVLALTILGILLDINKREGSSFSSINHSILTTLLKLSIFLLIVVLTYRFIKRMSKRENFIEQQLTRLLDVLKGKESLFAIFFVFILIFASVTEAVGLHFIIGSFFAAMLVGKDLVGEKHLRAIHNTTNSMTMGFLAPIFFAGIGLEFKFSSIHQLSLLGAILLVSFGSKIIGGYLGGRFAHLSNRTSIALGFGLNARGIMELVIANIAFRAGLIGVEIFSMLVVMGLVTTLSTPFLLKYAFNKIDQENGLS